jgi:hypothetical protein
LESVKRNILGRCALLAKEYQVNRAGFGGLSAQFCQHFVHGEGVLIFQPQMNGLEDHATVGVKEALRGDGFGDRQR